MSHYFWWIPCVVVYYAVYSWISKQNNTEVGTHSWVLVLFIYGIIAPWVIVSKFSKNLLFDGMLYDNLMFLTYVSTLLVLGAGNKFTLHQWMGLVSVVAGSMLLRIP